MSDIREDQIDIIDGKTQAEKREERTMQLAEIGKVYGDNLPYDRTRITNETKFYMAQSAEAMLQAGKGLVLLKEHEPHGVFIQILEDELGLHPRSAQRMMQASVKFLNLGIKNATTLSHLNSSKLFTLMSQDDEELEALAEGGTVAGLTLDEMDKMSVRDLKKALKEAKDNYSAAREVTAQKNKKIDELTEKLVKTEAKAKSEIKKLELDESKTDRLIKSYKLTLAEVTGDILASSSKLQQLFTKATDDALPQSFFQDFARELLSVRQNLELVAEQLPSDDGIIDTAWMDEA